LGEEYVNDVPYVRHFIADLGPPRLRLVAALNGVAPPSGDDFDYFEIGCAHGDTLAALAAAHPEGRFLGIDISPEHIASARKLAREGGLDNIGFLERDLAALLHEDIGEFDYIVAHGVLSWVSPTVRQALILLASAKLRPGGLLYVSYNTMPGWGSVEPLRQLLLSPLVGETGGSSPIAGTSLDRARRGLEFANAMESAGAGYFVKNPAASEMLATMMRAGLPYVVHEYLHEHWTPMYFARVAWEMAQCDLHFVGNLPALLDFRDTAIPESLEHVFRGVTDRITFESLKDFALNEFFRRDIYVKGRVPRSVETTNDYLDATPWATEKRTPPAERFEKLPHRTLAFDGPVYDALFPALAEGAASVSALADRPELATFGRDAVRAALLRLAIAERVLPMRASTRAPAEPLRGPFTIPMAYNRTMLRRLAGEAPLVLVSALAGTAWSTAALDGLAMRVLVEAEPDAHDAWIRSFVGRSVLRMTDGERVIEDREEQERLVLEKLAGLKVERLSKLVELGILAPAARPGRL
jgi:SAM-dependent methyltransferase